MCHSQKQLADRLFGNHTHTHAHTHTHKYILWHIWLTHVKYDECTFFLSIKYAHSHFLFTHTHNKYTIYCIFIIGSIFRPCGECGCGSNWHIGPRTCSVRFTGWLVGLGARYYGQLLTVCHLSYVLCPMLNTFHGVTGCKTLWTIAHCMSCVLCHYIHTYTYCFQSYI